MQPDEQRTFTLSVEMTPGNPATKRTTRHWFTVAGAGFTARVPAPGRTRVDVPHLIFSQLLPAYCWCRRLALRSQSPPHGPSSADTL